jgi:hypothetical protein
VEVFRATDRKTSNAWRRGRSDWLKKEVIFGYFALLCMSLYACVYILPWDWASGTAKQRGNNAALHDYYSGVRLIWQEADVRRIKAESLYCALYLLHPPDCWQSLLWTWFGRISLWHYWLVTTYVQVVVCYYWGNMKMNLITGFSVVPMQKSSPITCHFWRIGERRYSSSLSWPRH